MIRCRLQWTAGCLHRDTAWAMSQEAIDIARAAFEQFARGDFSANAGLSDEFELVLAPEMPDAGSYRGAAARRWLAAWVDSFDRMTQEAIEFIDAGDDQAVIEVLQRGWMSGSKAPVELRTWSVLTVQNGTPVRVQLFQIRSHALEAAGLTE
jgi:ketosteroid isomerase-like protein